jgi:hypothetical protein
MTTGTIRTLGPNLRQYVKYFPGGLEFEIGSAETGTRQAKTWSGVDSPPASKRKFEVKTYFLPEVTFVRTRSTKSGRFIVKRTTVRKARRLRVYEDRKRRKFREEHPYTMDAWQITSNPASSDSFEIDSSVYPPVSGRLTQTQYRDSQAWLGDGAVFTHRWSVNEDIALLGKLRQRIAGTGFNMGVFLGEGRKSLETITKTATALALSLRALKRGDLASAARALSVRPKASGRKSGSKQITSDELSSRWLELQYGWLPLVQDVHEGAGYLATRLNAPFVQSYRARIFTGSNPIFTQDWLSRKASGRTTKTIVARISEVSETQLAGLLDPASVAWELLPYSFIVDWFIPIGNYLHARALESALTGTYITTMVQKSATECGGLKPIPSGSLLYPHSQTFRDVLIATRRVSLNRTVSTSLSVPLPEFKPLGSVPSWKRAANSIALLTQAVLRR